MTCRKTNVIFSSVKFTSTIDVINKSVETMNHHPSTISTTHSTIDPTNKSVLRSIKSEITKMSDYNNILKKEIVPSLTTHTLNTYAHKHILCVGPDSLSYVYSALKQSLKTRNKYNQKDRPATVSSSYQKKTKNASTQNPNDTHALSNNVRYLYKPIPFNGKFYTLTEAMNG